MGADFKICFLISIKMIPYFWSSIDEVIYYNFPDAISIWIFQLRYFFAFYEFQFFKIWSSEMNI